MPLQEKIIKSEKDLEEGIKFLSQHDPILSHVIDREKIVLTKRDAGFSALLKTIISQQLSTLAAGKIWQRVVDNELNIQSNILKVNAETLLSLGLSRQKCSYALALAQDKLDYSILGEMDSNTVIKRLTEIKGIGQWTAQIYCMFSLARGDIFPSGDLALQEAIRGLFSLEKRPNIKEVDEISKRWTPWKTIAAIVLWDFYRQQKKREGVLW